MVISKQIEILKIAIQAMEELNGEHQGGWDDEIYEAEEMLEYLKLKENEK